MSLLYSLILKKDKKQILCHYTDYSAANEAQTICKNMISLIPTNPQGTLIYENTYNFHYKHNDSLIFMCCCNVTYPEEPAFAFLRELITEFYNQFRNDAIQRASTLEFNKQFEMTLRRIMKFYNINIDSKANANLKRLENSLSLNKTILIDATDKLFEIRDQWEKVFVKANSLKDEGTSYYANAKKVKEKVVDSKLKKACIIILIAALAYLLAGILCGGSALPNCFVTE